MAVMRPASSPMAARISSVAGEAWAAATAVGVRPRSLRLRALVADWLSSGWARPARWLQAATRQGLPQYFCTHRFLGTNFRRQYSQAIWEVSSRDKGVSRWYQLQVTKTHLVSYDSLPGGCWFAAMNLLRIFALTLRRAAARPPRDGAVSAPPAKARVQPP